MKQETAEKIIGEMEIGYDSIADKFSETRKHFWRDLEFIGEYAKKGDKVLDYGSGNGRILELFSLKPIEYTGADVSQNLVDIAAKKFMGNLKFVKIAGYDSLPFPDNYFNVIYSIAVFHHLPGSERRLKMAKELYRTLQPGGRIVVAVWNLWQPGNFKNILKNWINKIFGRSELDWNDCYIPFEGGKGNVFQRYHRVFTKKELENTFTQVGFTPEKCEIINGKNIFFVGKK